MNFYLETKMPSDDKTSLKNEKQDKRTSAIWEYFKILDDKTKVEYKMCCTNNQLKYNSRSIQKSREHLRAIHRISPQESSTTSPQDKTFFISKRGIYKIWIMVLGHESIIINQLVNNHQKI